MHLIIANRIAECLSIKDKAAFLLGGIAPDAVSPKDVSHFFVGDVQDYSRSVNYKGFLDKYSSLAEHEYIWGYYAHLIADHIWLQGFYLPWLRKCIELDKEVLPLYHNDFRILNGKLLAYYGLAEELRKSLCHTPAIIDLQEVKSKDVHAFIPDVVGDMNCDIEASNEKLNVFTWNQIIGYIETSVDIGLWHIKRIRTSCNSL
jgi:hypothetical protein